MMRLFLLALAISGICTGQSWGVALVCAEDEQTSQRMCFPSGPIRTSTDKRVREAMLYTGGPRSTTATGNTARVYCVDLYVPVLELRDRQGVVFARNQPEPRIGRDLVRFMCDHSPTKVDKALDKVPRY